METASANEQLITDQENSKEWLDFDSFLTEHGEVNGLETVEILNNQATFHALTKSDIFNKPAATSHTTFVIDRYSSESFQGIMPDSGAAGISTAGEPQFLALRKLVPSL